MIPTGLKTTAIAMMPLILLVGFIGNPLDNFMTVIDTQFFASRRSKSLSKSRMKSTTQTSEIIEKIVDFCKRPITAKTKKKCTECGLKKPRKDFLDETRNSDGKSGYCHVCHLEKRKNYRIKYVARKEEERKNLPDQSEVLKTCATDGQIKPKKEFGKCKKNPDGYEYDCKTCMRKYKNEWSDNKKKAVRKSKLPDFDKVIKECIHCGKPKPLRLFKKCNTSWDGTYNFCKKCDNKYSRELSKQIGRLRTEQRNILPDQSEVPKVCYQCNKEKPTKDFLQDKTSLDGTGNMCKKCYRKYQIEWAKKRQPLLEQMRAAMPDQSEVPKICIKCGHIKPTKKKKLILRKRLEF